VEGENLMTRKFTPGVILIYILMISLALAGCTPGKQTPGITGSPVSTQAPAQETLAATPEAVTQEPAQPTSIPSGGPKIATIAFVQDFDILNPIYAQALSSIYTQQIWNCRAWDFDDQNNPQPRLVKEIPSIQNGGISSDGRVITMKLRDDILWSDGQPITAQDFVFTYQMIIDPDNGVNSTIPYDQVENVSAPDERTVVVTFKQPYAAWLSALWHSLLPAHILQPVFESQGTLQNAEWNRAPTVGCGPFVFQSWESGQSARFVANERYWFGRPKLDEVMIRFVADDTAKVQALQSGQADLSVFLINSALYVQDIRNAGLTLIPANSGYSEGWFFYLDPTNSHPALRDVNVRQAIAMALNRDRIIQDLLGGGQKPVATYWDNTPYMAPGLKPWSYDPDKARQLLDQAGWIDSDGNGTREKDGVDLVLTHGTTTNEIRQAIQQLAKAQLAEVGITLELLNYDSGIFFQGYNEGGPAATGQLDIFQYAPRTKNYPDPGTNDFLCSQIPSANELGENWSWVCDEALDKLLQLQATQIDFQERQQTFHQISKMIFDNVYFLGLWSDPDLWAATPRLHNVRLSGVTPFFNIAEWDISP
jgi:peptide/nickel transport system substrate-binding protein